MRVNKKAILDTIEWAKTALANGMRVPPVPTSQVTEDILFKRAVVVALWAFWKPEQFQRQQGAGRWKAETPTINKVLSLLQTIDNVPVLDVQVDNDGMLHVKLIGAGVEHTEEDVDGDDDPDALWYTFIYAAFTPDMIAKITGNREKKFATWGYVHSIGEPQFGLGVLKAKTSCVTVRKDGAARPVYGAVVALTNDELDKMLKVALRETGVPHVLATLGVTTKGVRGAQQMYVPVPAPGGAPNGGAGGTRDFEAQDADAAASVRKTVDSLMALPAAADTYLQLLKPQQGAATTLHGIVDYLPGFNTYLLNINTKTTLTVLGDFPVIAAVKFSYYCQLGHGPFRGIRAANEEVKNLKGAAAEQAARVTPSMEMLANEYNALASTLPTHRGRTPAGVKSVLDSVADYLVKGILSCDDAHERAQRTGGTGYWLKGWAERLTELNIAPEKISAFNAAVITLMSNIDSALTALGQGAVFGVGASKPSVAEEVPTPAEPRFRMSPSAWESWKPKSKQQSALLDYLRMLFKSTNKTNRPIFDAVIDRLHKSLVSGVNKTVSTFSQIGDIVQRADMDSTKGSSFTQQALDFLLADVSGYANSLYEELRTKSELTDADIDSAEAIITALYPDNLQYPNDDIKDVLSVKQMSDLGTNLSNVLDSINALAEETQASTIAIEDPTYPLGRVPSGESDTYFHGSIVEVDFARHLNHTKEDIRECVVRYAYRSGALLEVTVEANANGKTQDVRVPGTSVVRVLELVTHPVNNTDSTAPVTNPVNNTDSTAPVSTNATVFAGLTSKELADRATSVGLPQQFLASKAGKAFVSSKDGQLWLARRAEVVATLTRLNSSIRELNSAMAYDTAVIESSDSNLDEMRDDLVARYNEVVGAQAAEVPTPKPQSSSIRIDQWQQWKPKAQSGRALLSYLIQLYKLSSSKAKADMTDGIISRLYQHIVPNGGEKYTHNKVGAIIQRADMDKVGLHYTVLKALDFLEQDVSAYASNLYEQLTQKSGVALHEIDAAEEIINSLYPEKMRVEKKLYDLSNKLISVRDDLDMLRSSTRSAVYVDTPETPVITDPATQCVFKYCLELLHWEGVAHKMARGGKAELMQEIEMLRRAAGLDMKKAPSFQQVVDALMQKAKADPDEADFMLRGIAQRAYDGINRIGIKWENFLPTMAYQERAYNVREMKVMLYLVSFWEDNLKAMGDLTGISQVAVASLTAAMDYATKVGDAIQSERGTSRWTA